MNKKSLFSVLMLGLVLAIAFESCGGKKKSGGTLNIRISADPDKLNPITKTTNEATRLCDLMFASVCSQNPVGNFEQVPFLSKENAKVSEVTEGEFKGGMKLEYEIREDAKWDNGTPILASDYVFTIKALLNPKVNCEPIRGYFSWLGDVVVDPANPKKFTIYSAQKYFQTEEASSYYILPEYNYDPNHLMSKFSVKDLNTDAKRQALKSNKDILKFAEEFNSEKYQRDPKYIVGAGPYRLESWTTGQEVVLIKKDSWWGDAHKDERQFWAYPKRIKMKIINDDNTAITALKDGQIDNYVAIKAKDYKELEKNDKFKSNFKMDKIARLSYSFIGLNLRNIKFQDINVRKALAHAVNRDKINEIVMFGESKKTESFVHNSQPHYNKDLKEYEFDLKKSNELLDAAGWKDSDGDGIRDKEINGKKTPLSIEFKSYKDESVKNIVLILQEDFKKLGIDFKIVEKEWTIFSADLDKQDFEMYTIGFTISPKMPDPKQQWHTSSSIAGGSNNVGWGDAASDKLIEDYRAELNMEKRQIMIKTLQQRIHDELPVIFMFNGVNRIATSKKFNIENIMISPGVLYNEFSTK